jgi:glycolate oxidase FAD binding subunit
MARRATAGRGAALVNPETTAEVVARVREARAAGAPLRITAMGSWGDAGAPVAATDFLSLSGLNGIVQYEPGDLTLTARAGTPLIDIERATAEHGQWLTLDPFGYPYGTLGATVATGSYGPLASAFGTPRNEVLGCEVVTGTGDVVRAGGRVVKNVAGFDVTRLMVGAWGTLGAITEVTVRLRARPEVDETVAIALGGVDGVERARRWLRTSEFTPLAAELLSPAFAERLGFGTLNADLLLLRLGGNEALVRAARRAAATLGDLTVPQDDRIWMTLTSAGLTHSHRTSLRLSAAPAGIAELWAAARRAIEPAGGLAHATLTRGVVRCLLPTHDDASVAQLRGILGALPTSTRIAERLPAALWSAESGDPVLASLRTGVRRAFDPDLLLNPGIMGTA